MKLNLKYLSNQLKLSIIDVRTTQSNNISHLLTVLQQKMTALLRIELPYADDVAIANSGYTADEAA